MWSEYLFVFVCVRFVVTVNVHFMDHSSLTFLVNLLSLKHCLPDQHILTTNSSNTDACEPPIAVIFYRIG